MANFAEALEALPEFRSEILRSQQSVDPTEVTALSAEAPDLNIHATGVGVRIRRGEIVEGDFVLKMFVFGKRRPDELGAAPRTQYKGIEIDVEELPVQLIHTGPAVAIPNRQKHRPIPGGVSTAPLGVGFVGTLGCFLRRRTRGSNQILALSNNHVFADTNSLPIGTQMVQPGPETGPTGPGDVYARLSGFIPIQFSTPTLPVTNRFDAAVAVVTDPSLVSTNSMLGVPHYQSGTVVRAVPGRTVVKSGRTTGVTRGTVTAVNVNGVQVNYGTTSQPRIAVFDGTIQIRGASGAFSRPGDSGSVIIDNSTGNPTALLFAGNGVSTTACDLAGVCSHFGAWPV